MTKESLERLVGYQSRIDLLRRYLEGEAESPQDQAVVQQVVEGFFGRPITAEEVRNPQVYVSYVQSVFDTDESRAKGLFGDQKEQIITALREDNEGKLAKLAIAALTPVEIKDDEIHNATAKAHKAYLGVAKLKDRVDKGEEVRYKEITDAVKPVVEQDIDRRLSEEANPDNKYLPNKVKQAVKAVAVNGITRVPIGREYLDLAVTYALQALDARFPNGEGDIVKYAEQTLRHMDEGRAREAVSKIYSAKLKE